MLPDGETTSLEQAKRQARRAVQDLQDIEPPTPIEAVLDLASTAMAVASLGVERGLWTEEEFIAAKMRAQTMLDEEQQVRKVEAEQVLTVAYKAQADILYHIVFMWCNTFLCADGGEFQVSVVQQPVSDDSEVFGDGSFWIRIISDQWPPREEPRTGLRARMIGSHLQKFSKEIAELSGVAFRLILLLPEEAEDDAENKHFNALVAVAVEANKPPPSPEDN